MSAVSASPAMRRFVDYFGALGRRWGLPSEACRVHAHLYLVARPATEEDLGAALGLDKDAVKNALAFLVDYRMIKRAGNSSWRTGGDPWDLLAGGLEERRRRELIPALATLSRCRDEALTDGKTNGVAARQIGKMLELVEGLASLDIQARRLSPRLLRGLVGLSSRTARIMDHALRR